VAFIVSLTFNIAAWHSRRRCTFFRFFLWLILWTIVSWAVVIATVLVIEGDVSEFEIGIVLAVFFSAFVLTTALFLPSLVLSFTNAFHRQRIEEFAGVDKEAMQNNLNN
jgi:uncharacterized membrane protein